MNHGHFRHDAESRSFWRSRHDIGLLVIGASAAFFLLSEHRANFFGAPSYLLLLACPLMNLMHGHDGHGRHPQEPGSRNNEKE